jgi:hypothetical protein
MVSQMVAFETRHGVLTGFAPRTFLWLLWAGEGLAVLSGLGSFLLIRRQDVASKSVVGIAVRSTCGLIMGLVGGVVLWLVVGHIVIGF